MNELSIFIDESGDFGPYDYHSPYYIVAMVFHNQNIDISNQITKLNKHLFNMNLPHHSIHTGPIIRQEENYKYMDIEDRRKIFNKMVAFTKSIDIKYKTFYIEKKHIIDSVEASGKLSKQIASFIYDNYQWFSSFSAVKVYYDNGQIELSRLLSTLFNALLPNIEFKKVLPKDYKLFQIADMICTFELLNLKLKNEGLSKSELLFFGTTRDLKRSYLRHIKKMQF